MRSNQIQTLVRYFHQARHLKPVQFYARIKARLQPLKLAEIAEVPSWRQAVADWVQPAPMPHRLLGDNHFAVLGHERTLDLPDGWQDREYGRKWLMELHAFHLLAADSDGRGRDLIRSWIAEVPPGEGPSWHPYITSLRIGNWLKWGLSGNALDTGMRRSLAQQMRYLLQRLMHDELDHKLLNNGKALMFAGHCLDDRDSPRWRTRGRELVRHYCRELLGNDGGYLNASPMYHCALLTDLLDVANLLRAYDDPNPHEFDAAVVSAGSWLAAMCHPDGRISLFNDSALDVAAEPQELSAYAARLGLPPLSAPSAGLTRLTETGFARMTLGPAVALLDIGKIGLAYSASHGHADTLTFELSLHARRLVVDTGLSTYEAMPDRLLQRETAAHNTLVLDGENSSDVWGHFKVGRRAGVRDVSEKQTPDMLHIGAAHDGFARRGNPILHRRDWEMTPTMLTIRDRVSGDGIHRAQIAFHFHPDILVEPQQDNRYLLRSEDGTLRCLLQLDAATEVQLQQYDYHPGFNRSVRAWKLVAGFHGELPLTTESRFSWDPTD